MIGIGLKMKGLGEKLEYLSRKWWFYLLLLLVYLFIPPFTSQGAPAPEEIGSLVSKVLAVGLEPYQWLAPFFHVGTVLLVLGLLWFGDKVTRVFSAYMGANFIFIAFAQMTAFLEGYGFVALTGGIITFSIVGIYWVWEAAAKRSILHPPSEIPRWKYWVVPFAVLAFWSPVEPTLNPLPLLTSFYGLAFCLTTPVFLAILSLYHPNVNVPAFRVTAFVGAFLGIVNVSLVFFGGDPWVSGILHLPLLLISTYCIGLTFREG